MKSHKETDFILHICLPSEWQSASSEGEYKPSSFAEIGFIHCSTPQQILRVANSYYQDAPELLLLWIDPAKIDAPIKWEAAEEELYPHIYGPLPLDAVIGTYRFVADSDKIFRSIPGMDKFGGKPSTD